MSNFTVEIIPKKAALDPLASQVKNELIEAGESPALSSVQTCRLYRIEGAFNLDQVDSIAQTLLVDPVVETARVNADDQIPAKKKKTKKEKPGWVVDIWPKPGVTDPVGETVQKGIRDLGFSSNVKSVSAQRYIFPKFSDAQKLKILAKRVLANELIHDIRLHKSN